MKEVPEPKADLRRLIQGRIDSLGAQAIADESTVLCGHLARWIAEGGWQVILATLPFAGEPDLTPLLRSWVGCGGGLALARTGPGRSLGFRYVDSLDGPWDSRPFGLKEPPLTAQAWEPGKKTLCLVPGLAFAPAVGTGALRLGRGAGYYDRWLAAQGAGVFALGVGLSVQTVDSLPVEDHDRPMDGWLDPAGFHGF